MQPTSVCGKCGAEYAVGACPRCGCPIGEGAEAEVSGEGPESRPGEILALWGNLELRSAPRGWAACVAAFYFAPGAFRNLFKKGQSWLDIVMFACLTVIVTCALLAPLSYLSMTASVESQDLTAAHIVVLSLFRVPGLVIALCAILVVAALVTHKIAIGKDGRAWDTVAAFCYAGLSASVAASLVLLPAKLILRSAGKILTEPLFTGFSLALQEAAYFVFLWCVAWQAVRIVVKTELTPEDRLIKLSFCAIGSIWLIIVLAENLMFRFVSMAF